MYEKKEEIPPTQPKLRGKPRGGPSQITVKK
jgi:hypothetical protein